MKPLVPPLLAPLGPPRGRGPRRGLLIGLIALGVVAAVAAVGVVVFVGTEDEGFAEHSIRLEPLGSTQDDAFTDNLDLQFDTLGEAVAVALADVPQLDVAVTSVLSGRAATGKEPGLYGGSHDTQVCDIQGLLDFLADPANADKAEAWADVQGIPAADIPAFVATLTPVRLRFDIRVTNHGFGGGRATPFQSVLQAGTAVLVDNTGVPRVKCNCGNPLSEPEAISVGDGGDEREEALDLATLAEDPGLAWEGLDPANIVTVEAGDELAELILVDLETGRLFRRPVGSKGDEDTILPPDQAGDLCQVFAQSPTCLEPVLGTGEVQVTLRWNSGSDLDLGVFEPDGTEIWAFNPGPTATGAELDVDANCCIDDSRLTCGTDPPVENIFWPEGEGRAPTGTYTVRVRGFDFDDPAGNDCGSGGYTITVTVGGQVVLDETDTVAVGEEDLYTFDA